MSERTEEIIVSLTTYPPRIGTVVEVIDSLRSQTVAPDRICLWLGEDDFPDRDDALDGILSALEERDVEVCWCERTLGPHDKYFWTIRAHPEAVVITVDDDVHYPPDLVERLIAAHRKHPSAVAACRTHLVTTEPDERGMRLAPYASWVHEQDLVLGEPRCDLLATGVGGILYPPHVFDGALFDEGAIRESALFADDLWLFAHELRTGIPVVATEPYGLSYVVDSQECALYHENLDRGGNDAVLDALSDRFPDEFERLIDRAKDNEASCSEFESCPEQPSRVSLIDRLKRKLARCCAQQTT